MIRSEPGVQTSQSSYSRQHLGPTTSPLAVAEMFDKTATTAKLHAAGIPVLDWLSHARDVFAVIAYEKQCFNGSMVREPWLCHLSMPPLGLRHLASMGPRSENRGYGLAFGNY